MINCVTFTVTFRLLERHKEVFLSLDFYPCGWKDILGVGEYEEYKNSCLVLNKSLIEEISLNEVDALH